MIEKIALFCFTESFIARRCQIAGFMLNNNYERSELPNVTSFVFHML